MLGLEKCEQKELRIQQPDSIISLLFEMPDLGPESLQIITKNVWLFLGSHGKFHSIFFDIGMPNMMFSFKCLQPSQVIGVNSRFCGEGHNQELLICTPKKHPNLPFQACLAIWCILLEGAFWGVWESRGFLRKF